MSSNKINWKTCEAQQRLVAAIIATNPGLKLDYKDMAKHMGSDVSHHALGHQFRPAKHLAKLQADSLAKGRDPKDLPVDTGALKEAVATIVESPAAAAREGEIHRHLGESTPDGIDWQLRGTKKMAAEMKTRLANGGDVTTVGSMTPGSRKTPGSAAKKTPGSRTRRAAAPKSASSSKRKAHLSNDDDDDDDDDNDGEADYEKLDEDTKPPPSSSSKRRKTPAAATPTTATTSTTTTVARNLWNSTPRAATAADGEDVFASPAHARDIGGGDGLAVVDLTSAAPVPVKAEPANASSITVGGDHNSYDDDDDDDGYQAPRTTPGRSRPARSVAPQHFEDDELSDGVA